MRTATVIQGPWRAKARVERRLTLLGHVYVLSALGLFVAMLLAAVQP